MFPKSTHYFPMTETINENSGAPTLATTTSPNSVSDEKYSNTNKIESSLTPEINDCGGSRLTNNTFEATEEQNQLILQALLDSLKAQLEYYFSPTNLARDSFLTSLMASTQLLYLSDDDENAPEDQNQEEGRNAPVTVIARFGNVQKIINQFEEQRRQVAMAAYMDETEIEKESFYRVIPFLLRDAALLSPVLEVVLLANPYPAPMYSNNEEYLSTCYGKEAVQQCTNAKKDKANILAADVFRLGVGPIPSCTETQPEQTIEANDKKTKPEQDTIILRDMPSSTTKEEIHELFSWDNCPKIKTVHSDVGNCWFVSLDGTNDVIVDTLLALRSKKFKGEFNIKARLKTESVVKATSNYYSIHHTDSNNGYAGHYGSGRPQYNRRNGPGASRYGTTEPYGHRNRYQPILQYADGKFPNGRTRGSRIGDNENVSSKETQVTTMAPPPPPLEHESHFPALGGSATSKVSTSPTVDASSGSFASAAAGAKDAPPSLKEDFSEPISKISTSVTTSSRPEANKPPTSSNDNSSVKPSVATATDSKKSVCGYAAALLKVAVPVPQYTSKISHTSTHKNTSKKGDTLSSSQKNKKPSIVSSTVPKSSGSTATTMTDSGDRFSDSSSTSVDDKSCSSSARYSDNKTSVAPTPPVWGSKKSFAEVLKKV